MKITTMLATGWLWALAATQANAALPGDTLETLAQSEAWRALLHYKGPQGEWRSEIDDPRFFLAPAGAIQPEAELQATLEALAQPQPQGDAHAQCRFPARFHWLKSVLPRWAEQQPPKIDCPAYDEWLGKLRPAGVSLIFPAAYINSPSSMFGHTFLRVDGEGQDERTRLLAYSISYGAEVPENENGFVYLWKGLLGGYPGFFTGAAYYDKVIEYSDIEARDIWEYVLKLSDGERDQLLRHTWELQHMRVDYFFFDENCSYQLLSLIDVARPGLRSTDAFTTHTAPADTVRVLDEAGLIGKVSYRPSILTILRAKAQQLDGAETDLALALALGTTPVEAVARQGLDARRQALVLDFAYEYLQYRIMRGGEVPETGRTRSLALLSGRSRLPQASSPKPITPTPPEQGHRSGRVDVGVVDREGTHALSLSLKPTFHDELDLAEGYVPGAKINFLVTEALWWEERETLELEHFRLLEIKANPARTAFFKPLSWQVGTGWQQRWERGDDELRFYVDGGAGLTYGQADAWTLSLWAKAQLRAGANAGAPWQHGGGVVGELLFSFDNGSRLQLEAGRWDYESIHPSDGDYLRLGLNLPLGKDHALRLQAQSDQLRGARQDQVQLAWLVYF